MALNTIRTAPQKSFGRRVGPAPQTSASPSHMPVPVPVEEILKEAQPAAHGLSEIVGQSIQAAREASPRNDQPTDDLAARATVGHVIGRSLAVLGKNPVTFLALLAVIALPEQFVAYLPVSLGAPAEMIMPLFTTLGCMALYAAAFHGALTSLNGETMNLDACLRAMARTKGSAYGIIAMTVSCLSLMLVIPAIGFAGRWVLAAPVSIVEGGDARARSLALTAPYRARVRLLVLSLAGLLLLRGLVLAALSANSVVSALAGDWLSPMLLTVFTAVASAVLYQELVPSRMSPS